ncbi:hypothetical protein PoB_001405800 [Plakobranchus ocellatus]|uniref:Uncharacterized protein n=1 Tax=Plakobranchus ocellatus TaxID=259542 RepID=A0AAV3YYU7_9GAST|nr:hypothetical protein PoB_001405800 [Plakobranchus ocellatus]
MSNKKSQHKEKKVKGLQCLLRRKGQAERIAETIERAATGGGAKRTRLCAPRTVADSRLGTSRRGHNGIPVRIENNNRDEEAASTAVPPAVEAVITAMNAKWEERLSVGPHWKRRDMSWLT